MAWFEVLTGSEELRSLIERTARDDLAEQNFEPADIGETIKCDVLKIEATKVFEPVVEKIADELKTRMFSLSPIQFKWRVCRLHEGTLTGNSKRSCIVPLPLGTGKVQAVCYKDETESYNFEWEPDSKCCMYKLDEDTYFAAESLVCFILLVFS
ncbi:hypothetical protein PGQ11_002784 [Apiospora arundinis]|uniref:Uncharacterized protein n=1 Tax=Apiospora arundinis TaxID=335852 RepID=A0ABR2J313_9PEZI